MTINSKQVEEMAGDVISAAIRANAIIDRSVAINLKEFINNLYNAGYKKSAEVLKEMAIDFYSEMYDFAYRAKSYYTDALNDIIAKIDETFNDFRVELESLLREYGVEVEE